MSVLRATQDRKMSAAYISHFASLGRACALGIVKGYCSTY